MVRVLFFLFITFLLSGSGKPAYTLFTKEGKTVSWDKMIKQLEQSDIILFGELHNNPISHWIQLQLVKELVLSKDKNLNIGAEMVEVDDQLVVDEYLRGLTDFKHVETEISDWPNFSTDYKPLLDFSKERGLKFLATNVPRRYAALVARNGLNILDTLSEEAKMLLCPLPVDFNAEEAGYADLNLHGHGHHMPYLAEAQALKDATMANVILGQAEEDKTIFHIHGAFHSQNYQGIYWFLKKARPDLKISVITTVEQENSGKLEEDNIGKADFLIVVPEDMTKTY